MSQVNPEDIMDTFYHVGRQMKSRLHGGLDMKALEKISPHQIYALKVLVGSSQTMGELAEEMETTLPTATSLVDRLVKSGWVVREQDDNDRRVVRLRVTKDGLKLMEKMKKQRLKAFGMLLDTMPEHDQQEFYRILKNVQATLEKEKEV